MTAAANHRLRLDKWLWYARFYKTRSLAAKACAAHRLRINGEVVSKSHATVKPGDVLTFPLRSDIRVIEVLALGRRRGPAPEAQGLYDDLSPPEILVRKTPAGDRSGRPTKAGRRAIMRLKEGGF
jgi:ribosome-associated heat shock protein Hsp15